MITLADLRALLERALTHAENPAIVRLTDRTVEGLARAYLPRWLPWVKESRETALMLAWAVQVYGKATLALTDPGTAHALLVALALALGLDPGVGGVACAWFKRQLGGYILLSDSANWTFDAAEPDPFKALALAVRHLLENP